jgi:hypothetical protein
MEIAASTTPLRVFDFGQLPTSVNGNMSFVRDSEASYFGPDGYLHFAPAGINLLINSQRFNDNGWNQVGTIVSTTTATQAPDGSNSAGKIIEKTITSEHRVSQSVNVVKGKAVTISIYVKAGTCSKVQFSFSNTSSYTGGNPGVIFNLSNGTFISKSSNVISYQAINSGNGWWRLKVTGMPDLGTASGLHLYMLNDNNQLNYGVNSGRYLYAWGAQIGFGTVLSAYVPTTAAPYFGLRYQYEPSDTPTLAGVLIEPQATNLVRHSDNFDNITWIARNASVVSSGTRSPDGTINSFKIKEDSSEFSHYLAPSDNVSTTYGTTYTFSAFFKAAERKWAYFNIQNDTVHFDLVNGVVGNKNADYSDAGMESAGNGWYRCYATFKANSSETSAKIGAEIQNGDIAYKGNGSYGVLVWGVQMERGDKMTSYIRTKNSIAFRSKDELTLNKPTSAAHDVFIQRDSGSIWVENVSGNLDVPTSAATVRQISFYDADYTDSQNEEQVSVVAERWASTGPSTTLVPILGQSYMSQTPNKSWSLMKATNRTAPVFRFEIRSGDRWSGDLSSPKIKERCEFYAKNGDLPYDKDVWLSYSIRIAPGQTSPMLDTDFCLLGQFHATEDSGEMSTGPVLGIRLEGADKLAVYSAASLQNPMRTAPTYVKRATATYTRGIWHTVVMRIRFSPTRGQLQWWQNGKEIVNLSGIGIGYVDSQGPYWKFGIYRMAKPQTLIVDYANMEITSTASLYSRIAKPLAIS